MVERCRQKERTRTRILDEAARAIREQGAGGIGVAALMQRAGLTHGGFYAHFENRDDLIAKAFDRMRADSQEMLRRNLDTQSAADGTDRLIDDSLSDRMMHRIHASCPLPILDPKPPLPPPPSRPLSRAPL